MLTKYKILFNDNQTQVLEALTSTWKDSSNTMEPTFECLFVPFSHLVHNTTKSIVPKMEIDTRECDKTGLDRIGGNPWMRAEIWPTVCRL